MQTPQMTKLKLCLINKINNYGNDAKKEVELDQLEDHELIALEKKIPFREKM